MQLPLQIAVRNMTPDGAAEHLVRRQEGAVKRHEAAPRGVVRRLLPHEGYRFLETADGRAVCFHRNAVLHGGFDRLRVGDEVRFAEEPGAEGPQASTVARGPVPERRA